jgi:hypothetical protein
MRQGLIAKDLKRNCFYISHGNSITFLIPTFWSVVNLHLKIAHPVSIPKPRLCASLFQLTVLMIIDQMDRFTVRLKACIMALHPFEDVQ